MGNLDSSAIHTDTSSDTISEYSDDQSRNSDRFDGDIESAGSMIIEYEEPWPAWKRLLYLPPPMNSWPDMFVEQVKSPALPSRLSVPPPNDEVSIQQLINHPIPRPVGQRPRAKSEPRVFYPYWYPVPARRRARSVPFTPYGDDDPFFVRYDGEGRCTSFRDINWDKFLDIPLLIADGHWFDGEVRYPNEERQADVQSWDIDWDGFWENDLGPLYIPGTDFNPYNDPDRDFILRRIRTPLGSHSGEADGEFDSRRQSPVIDHHSDDELVTRDAYMQSLESQAYNWAEESIRFEEQADDTRSTLSHQSDEQISEWTHTASSLVNHASASETVEYDAVAIDDYRENQVDPSLPRKRKATDLPDPLGPGQTPWSEQEGGSHFNDSESSPKRPKVAVEASEYQLCQPEMTEEEDRIESDPRQSNRDPTEGQVGAFRLAASWRSPNIFGMDGANDVEDGKSSSKRTEIQKTEPQHAAPRLFRTNLGLDGNDDHDFDHSDYSRKPSKGQRDQLPASSRREGLRSQSHRSDQQVVHEQRGHISMQRRRSSRLGSNQLAVDRTKDKVIDGKKAREFRRNRRVPPVRPSRRRFVVDKAEDKAIDRQNRQSSAASSPLSSVGATPKNPFTDDRAENGRDKGSTSQASRNHHLEHPISFNIGKRNIPVDARLGENLRGNESSKLLRGESCRQFVVGRAKDKVIDGQTSQKASERDFEPLVDPAVPRRQRNYVGAPLNATIARKAVQQRNEDADHIHADIMAGKYDDVKEDTVLAQMEVDFSQIDLESDSQEASPDPATLLQESFIQGRGFREDRRVISESRIKNNEEKAERKWFAKNEAILQLEWSAREARRSREKYHHVFKATETADAEPTAFDSDDVGDFFPIDDLANYEMVDDWVADDWVLDDRKFLAEVDNFYGSITALKAPAAPTAFETGAVLAPGFVDCAENKASGRYERDAFSIPEYTPIVSASPDNDAHTEMQAGSDNLTAQAVGLPECQVSLPMTLTKNDTLDTTVGTSDMTLSVDDVDMSDNSTDMDISDEDIPLVRVPAVQVTAGTQLLAPIPPSIQGRPIAPLQLPITVQPLSGALPPPAVGLPIPVVEVGGARQKMTQKKKAPRQEMQRQGQRIDGAKAWQHTSRRTQNWQVPVLGSQRFPPLPMFPQGIQSQAMPFLPPGMNQATAYYLHENRETLVLRFRHRDILLYANNILSEAAARDTRAGISIWEEYGSGLELMVSASALTNVRGWCRSLVPWADIL